MQEVYNAAKAENAEQQWEKISRNPDFNVNAQNAVSCTADISACVLKKKRIFCKQNGNTALITAAYKAIVHLRLPSVL